jgi:hypothetical protein
MPLFASDLSASFPKKVETMNKDRAARGLGPAAGCCKDPWHAAKLLAKAVFNLGAANRLLCDDTNRVRNPVDKRCVSCIVREFYREIGFDEHGNLLDSAAKKTMAMDFVVRLREGRLRPGQRKNDNF